MVENAAMVNKLLNTLEDEDYGKAVSYIQFLSESRRKQKERKAAEVMDEIQSVLGGEKGWESEEAMLEDMAKFRRERLGL